MRNFLLLIGVLFFSKTAWCQPKVDYVYHPMTGTLVFTLEGGATYPLMDFKTSQLDYAARFLAEYYVPFYTKSFLGFRLQSQGGYVSAKDDRKNPTKFRTEYLMTGGSLVYGYSIDEALFPYISAGVLYQYYTPKKENDSRIFDNGKAGFSNQEMAFSSELGFRVALSRNCTFNFGTQAVLGTHDIFDGVKEGTDNDIHLTGFAGLSIAFFASADEDTDGVEDSKDMCPHTPHGAKVDEFGCPVDSDRDGVPDYIDKCPGTPAKVQVDEFGCPLDGDKDGVADYIDLCPGTPKGVVVDESGCPKDMDGDGVPDYLDQCPGTPKGAAVDKNGCPLDTDGDNVPDYLDQCPNTPQGVQVDAVGCPLKKEKEQVIKEVQVVKEVPVEKQTVLSAGTSFAPGKAVLQPAAFETLDKLVTEMNASPKSKWIIEGHTDNRGSAELNKKISTERAKAVLNYFVSKGIKKTRFSVRGLGADFPIADNSSEDGRSKNRRVVILRVD